LLKVNGEKEKRKNRRNALLKTAAQQQLLGAKSCGFTGLVLLQGAFDAADASLDFEKKNDNNKDINFVAILSGKKYKHEKLIEKIKEFHKKGIEKEDLEMIIWGLLVVTPMTYRQLLAEEVQTARCTE
jgi:hypothetical protein